MVNRDMVTDNGNNYDNINRNNVQLAHQTDHFSFQLPSDTLSATPTRPRSLNKHDSLRSTAINLQRQN